MLDVRHDMGKHQLALADYNSALELDPQDAEAMIDRGNLHAMLGSWQLAANDYRQAIRADKNSALRLSTGSVDDGDLSRGQVPERRSGSQSRSAGRGTSGRLIDDPSYEDAAAAMATGGKFDQAVEAQRKAIEMLEDQHESLNVPAGQLHQQHQPVLDGGPGLSDRRAEFV